MKHHLRALAVTGIFSLLFVLNSNSQGNLLITPRRVVFEGSKRSIDLNLANIGQDSATYAISVVQIRMRDDGGFEQITEPDPGQHFADKNIRYFPRSVTLGPNEAQVVKVQLVRTGELTQGEYRSHLYFRSVPNIKPLGEENTQKDSSAISIRLTPIFGITIPVIIRIGENTAGVTLTDPELINRNDSLPNLGITFNRTGNMSVYGDLTIDYISPEGDVTQVGMANGIAVYTPNTTRRFSMNLRKAPGVDLTTGSLKIKYSAPSDIKPATYAETVLDLK